MATRATGSSDGRPRTAVPRTAGSESQRWSEEDYDDDDDPGMFSFARPTTGEQNSNSTNPSYSHQYPSQSFPSNDNLTSNPFSFALPTLPENSNFSSDPSYPSVPPTAATSDPVLSPAAAYALSNYSSPSGPRKRTSFSAPDSPSYIVGNPYEDRLRQEELRRSSTQSSRDKIEALDSNWADQQNLSYALTPDGQAIMLNEMGEPIRLATSREQKMLADMGVSDYVPYRIDQEYDEEEEDSPYPEVRASVSNIDDPEMPVLTFRAWIIGLFFCIVVSALNCFFNFRYPAPLISPILIQLLSYPLGKLFARYLPITSWRFPRWSQKLGLPHEFSLNPGPFNIKEHTILVIMGNISTTAAYGLTFSVASDKFYGVTQGAGFDILLVLTTQVVGFGAAGLCRRFLVWPAGMIWPQNLVFCTLLNTLHAEDEDDGGGITRFRFFLYVFCGAFAWFFLPGTSHRFSCLSSMLLIQLCFSRFPLRRSLRFLMGLLDRTKYVLSLPNSLRSQPDIVANRQRRRQSTLRSFVGTRNGIIHFRLESNRLPRISSRCSLVGRGERVLWICSRFLVYRSDHVLPQRLFFSFYFRHTRPSLILSSLTRSGIQLTSQCQHHKSSIDLAHLTTLHSSSIRFRSNSTKPRTKHIHRSTFQSLTPLSMGLLLCSQPPSLSTLSSITAKTSSVRFDA